MQGIPTLADFQRNRVTLPDQTEVLRQPLYDHQIYPAAGTQSLSFFQTPIGQGITSALGAVAATAKTLWDTNMSLGGMLPNGMGFMIESVEVSIYPGSVSTASTYTVDSVTFFLAAASAVPTAQVDDIKQLYQSGMLELNVLSKNTLRDTPLMKFPPKTNYTVEGAIASNSTTTAEVGFASGKAVGRPYYLEPPVFLQSMMNFGVDLRWPGLVALTSTFNARIGVTLDGYMARAAQ